MEKDLYDMVDELIDRKTFKDRSHAINAAVDFLPSTLKTAPIKFNGPRNKPKKQINLQQHKGKKQLAS